MTGISAEAFEGVQACLRRVGQGLRQAPPTEVREKAPLDLVSALDFWSEAEITAYLTEHFPGDAVLSEESSSRIEYAERIWVLDPLDGTVNRTSDVPFFAVSLALLEAGQPVVGFVYDPSHDEMFTAQKGRGAQLDGERIQVALEPSRAIAVTSKLMRRLSERAPEQLHQLLLAQGRIRNFGAQALHLCYVGAGRLTAAASAETRLWDNAAGALIVSEAGGVFSTLDGRDPFPLAADDDALQGAVTPCLAGAPEMHARLLPCFLPVAS